MTCPNSRWELFEDEELKELLGALLIDGRLRTVFDVNVHEDLVTDLTKEIENRKILHKIIDEEDE